MDTIEDVGQGPRPVETAPAVATATAKTPRVARFNQLLDEAKNRGTASVVCPKCGGELAGTHCVSCLHKPARHTKPANESSLSNFDRVTRKTNAILAVCKALAPFNLSREELEAVFTWIYDGMAVPDTTTELPVTRVEP